MLRHALHMTGPKRRDMALGQSRLVSGCIDRLARRAVAVPIQGQFWIVPAGPARVLVFTYAHPFELQALSCGAGPPGGAQNAASGCCRIIICSVSGPGFNRGTCPIWALTGGAKAAVGTSAGPRLGRS